MKPDLDIREIAEFPVMTLPLSINQEEVAYDELILGDRGIVVATNKNGNEWNIVSRMSSQYQLVRHPDILDAIESVFESNKLSYELKEMMLHGTLDSSIRARYILTDFESSGHNPIIDVNNSYDGLSKFHVHFGVWRQVCSNGMMGYGKEYICDKIHIRESVSLLNIFESIDKFINTEFLMLVNKTEQLRRVKPVPLESLVKNMRPKESENFVVSEIIDKYYQELGENRLAQLNAVTDFAKSLSTERRIFFETGILKTLS